MDKFARRTAPLSDADSAQAISSETQAPIEGAEGFGCPNEYSCNAHCRGNGFRGGYCDSWFRRRCHCY
ncbi:actinodefensin [Actinomyces johnsonii]|jgi:defensin MGD-1 (fragment)|uniref:actinodefensin n=1 Tax=Actinomyces johnsonii TaxID=544581 RepID=UPI003F90AB88